MGKVTQVAGVTIHCCICLQRGVSKRATTIIKGYAVCGDDVELVSRPDFDIHRMRGNLRPV